MVEKTCVATMNKVLLFALLFFPLCGDEPPEKAGRIAQHYTDSIEEPEAALFVPPPGWLAADPDQLPKSVKAMVIGKGSHDYPPSINLGMERYEGSLKNYLKTIKTINESQHASWKDLGQIATESGNASLSQVDMQTEWGDVRLMHAIIVRYGTAYILTAAALKEDFPEHYKEFFAALRSLKINKDVYEMCKNPELRAKLQYSVQHLKKEWLELVNEAKSIRPDQPAPSADQLFCSETFQKELWAPFEEQLTSEFGELGEKWKECMCNKAKQELGL